MEIPVDILLDMFKSMTLIREFEERAGALMEEARIPGAVHLYCGEEAVAVGVCANLGDRDYITSTHRGHGHLLAKGGDPGRAFAELFGKAAGYCKGKGGSMHIADLEIGMLGANGIVAGGISIVTGAGLAAQLEGKGRVAVSFFGDGASNAGPFHESINIAAAWKLPMLYVCENNLWSANTAAATTLAVGDVAARASGYGIPGVVVDGNDATAVHEVAEAAVSRARAGDGPTLIECKTYRWRAHTERPGGEDARPPEEVEEWRARDPIARLISDLKSQGLLSDTAWEEMDAAILAEIEEAVKFAEESPFPEPAAALEDVFAG